MTSATISPSPSVLAPNSAQVRLRPLDFFFRALAILGVIEIIAFVINYAAHPQAPGIAGQTPAFRIFLGLMWGPTMLLVGAWLLWRAPGNVVSRFAILVGVTAIGGQFIFDLGAPERTTIAFEVFVLFGAGLVAPMLGYMMFMFPSGQIYPSNARPLLWGFAVIKFIGVALEILASQKLSAVFALPPNPLFVPALAPFEPIIGPTIGIVGVMLPMGLMAGMASLVRRYRGSAPLERVQIKWVTWGLGILLTAYLLNIGMIFVLGRQLDERRFGVAAVIGSLAQLAFVLSLAVAITKHHLFDIDILINRTLVYGAVTATIIGLYVAIVGLLGEVFYASGNIVLSLVATGIVAILFQPLRERVQHGVNRLLYGNRDEPYAVLSRLSHQLATTLEPEAVLPNIVETVARNLKLPYAAIELVNDAGNPHESLVITFGNPSACTLSLPLEYQGEKMGKLILAQRTPDEPFTPSEHRLLINIADQAGVAAHAFRLTRVLQRSREQLVTSREEERRRIQRDLHDGLGPALATMKLKLDSLQYLLPIDIGKSSELASDVAGDVQRALDDIRLLVHELRPPALDQLGLVAALREFATRLTCETGDCLQVEIEASPLPPLAAAVEVAAYRIVTEALTNVIKHAHARHCIVTITKDIPSSGIIVTIEDDGIGLQANAHATVGLRSMRERAEELGGKLAIESRVPSGTRVKAWLPWSE